MSGHRCRYCGSESCRGLCSGKAAAVERQRVIDFLRAKQHPMADQWAKEIEAQEHIQCLF